MMNNFVKIHLDLFLAKSFILNEGLKKFDLKHKIL